MLYYVSIHAAAGVQWNYRCEVATVQSVLVWSWWQHRQTFIQLHFEDLLLKDNAGLMKGHWKINCCRNKLKPKNLPGVINEKAKTCVRRMQHYCMQRAVAIWSWVKSRGGNKSSWRFHNHGEGPFLVSWSDLWCLKALMIFVSATQFHVFLSWFNACLA